MACGLDLKPEACTRLAKLCLVHLLSCLTGTENILKLAWFNSGLGSRSSPARGKTSDYRRNSRSGELRLRHHNLPDFESGLKTELLQDPLLFLNSRSSGKPYKAGRQEKYS
jgi:hypothetical protein